MKGGKSLSNLLLIRDYITTELKTGINSVQILAMLDQFFELLVRDASHFHIHAKGFIRLLLVIYIKWLQNSHNALRTADS